MSPVRETGLNVRQLAGGCRITPINRIVPDRFSRNANTNGRSIRTGGGLQTQTTPTTTAVTAAASVPSSFTSTYVLCSTSVIVNPPARLILLKSAKSENATPIPRPVSGFTSERLFSSLNLGRYSSALVVSSEAIHEFQSSSVSTETTLSTVRSSRGSTIVIENAPPPYGSSMIRPVGVHVCRIAASVPYVIVGTFTVDPSCRWNGSGAVNVLSNCCIQSPLK